MAGRDWQCRMLVQQEDEARKPTLCRRLKLQFRVGPIWTVTHGRAVPKANDADINLGLYHLADTVVGRSVIPRREVSHVDYCAPCPSDCGLRCRHERAIPGELSQFGRATQED